MVKPGETKGKMLFFFFREMRVFSPESVVNLKQASTFQKRICNQPASAI
jgi:hypothetical protein